LLSSQRLLLKGQEPVQLGSRALDILIALTANAGEPVSGSAFLKRKQLLLSGNR
jgi:DNA-binding winged helix-turn-helix (wHTH) protein